MSLYSQIWGFTNGQQAVLPPGLPVFTNANSGVQKSFYQSLSDNLRGDLSGKMNRGRTSLRPASIAIAIEFKKVTLNLKIKPFANALFCDLSEDTIINFYDLPARTAY